MRIAIGIEYDGRGFSGWQRLPHARTLQAEMEAALARVADHPVTLYCAGRTDAGVHATGQVAHFDTTAERNERAWVLGTNSNLPDDVCVLWTRVVPAAFHARFSAHGRAYHYRILNRPARPAAEVGRVTWEYRPLDVPRMQLAADSLLGEHDFSAFRAAECQAKTAVKNLRQLDVRRDGEYVSLLVQADAFLYHMVRNLAGVLMDIGAGARPVEWARAVLECRDRRQAGVTAPAAGLTLSQVFYPSQFALPTR